MSKAEPSNSVPDARRQASIQLKVEGLHCAGCVGAVEAAIRKLPGVETVTVELATGTGRVSGMGLRVDDLVAAVRDQGYGAQIENPDLSLAEQRTALEAQQKKKLADWSWRARVGLLLWLPIFFLHMPMDLGMIEYTHGWHQVVNGLAAVLATLSQGLVGLGFYRSAWNAAQRRLANMDTLIALGSTVAWGYSAVVMVANLAGWNTGLSMYWEAAAGLLALVSLGHWLEARAMFSANTALRDLLALQPEMVQRLQTITDQNGEIVPASQIKPTELLLVKPGDRLAVDGEVVSGTGAVDESAVTGEPLPVEKTVGSKVVAGSLNTNGRLIVRAESDGRSTSLARIAEFVRQAQASKAGIARLADQVCAVFVPGVLLIALATCFGWIAYGYSFGDQDVWRILGRALVNATSVLVISCPCALGLATPTAIMVGAGAASRRGILVKNASSFERASQLHQVLLDKTGTLTEGRPMVTQVWQNGTQQDDVLRLAASLARGSRHPLSTAIVQAAARQNIEPMQIAAIREEAGRGIRARLDRHELALISASAYVHQFGVLPPPLQNRTETISLLLKDSEWLGAIAFEDQIRPDAPQLIRQLRNLGLEIGMLTGDRIAVANRVAATVGISPEQVRAEITPQGKREVVLEMARKHRRVAMVGDGINDAAALAEAGVHGGIGLAIGTGTNIAMESADLVIPAQRLSAITESIQISRATLRTIKQNLFLSFVYNGVAIPLAAFGYLGNFGPLLAAAAMMLSDLAVVGNSLWLKWALVRQFQDAPRRDIG